MLFARKIKRSSPHALIMQRTIALLDIDYFYAQCELLRNPSLKGKPVVVIMPTIRENTGAVATCNYEARALKIRSGMSLSLAKKLSNVNTIFIKADKEYYKELSSKVFGLIDFYCSKVEQVSIDEAYLDLTNPQGFEKAVEACEKIKERIVSELGLTCSIGLSINKLIAKMASEEKKPDGLFIVQANEVDSFIEKMVVGKIHGLGPKSVSILKNEGISTVRELKTLKKSRLIELFGEARGSMFYDFAQGRDDREIDTNREKQQTSRMMTLKTDSSSIEEMDESLTLLCELVFNEVKKIKRVFLTCSIIIVTPKFETITKSKTLSEPIKSVEELKRVEKQLLEAFMDESLQKVRRLGVRVSNFSEDYGFQKKLFDY
jgi:DNA polymerase IV (archaeal DinB-like DNA polymerase)